MKNKLLLIILLITNFSFSALPLRAETVCKVTDPTGTPLNVRTSPNGKIKGTLKNRQEVYIESIEYDAKGRPWARVGGYILGDYKVLGWVFREFISCYDR